MAKSLIAFALLSAALLAAPSPSAAQKKGAGPGPACGLRNLPLYAGASDASAGSHTPSRLVIFSSEPKMPPASPV